MKTRLLDLLMVLLPILMSGNLKAQFCENTFKGAFTVPSEGCTSTPVTLTNNMAGAVGVYYAYEFDKKQTTAPDPKYTTSDLTYSYATPGTYTILQVGSANGTGFTLCKDIKIRETAAPKAEISVCADGAVRLTLVENAVSGAYDQIEINWGDGTQELWSKGKSPVFDKKFSGTVPDITVRGRYADGLCNNDLKTNRLSGQVTPGTVSMARINGVEMTSQGSVNILYTGEKGIATEVYIDKGSGLFEASGKSSSTGEDQSATIANLNPAQVYRFKLVSKDICGNPVESAVVSSTVLRKEVISVDEANSVSWEKYPDSGKLIQYQLYRDKGQASEKVFPATTNLSYLDTEVKCGQGYSYSVVVIEGDFRSYSAPVSITPGSASPEQIKVASVTVESSSSISSLIELSGEGLTTTYNLIVERANAGSNAFEVVSGSKNQSLSYTDETVNAGQTSYCYRFIYENACNLKSPPSDVVCSILLTNNVQHIDWTGASPFTGGISSYDLVQMDEDGKVTDEQPKQMNLSHNIDLNVQSGTSYKIKASSNAGNLVSYSNVVGIRRDVIILIPDAFTPNGDGINERFEVKSYFTSKFEMKIYNRWGEVMFRSENSLDGWDGRVSGKEAPAGYYLYKINIITGEEEAIVKTGSIMLIR
jgi:gliding motility-associated-like protein